jgi:hypothetical protein
VTRRPASINQACVACTSLQKGLQNAALGGHRQHPTTRKIDDLPREVPNRQIFLLCAAVCSKRLKDQNGLLCTDFIENQLPAQTQNTSNHNQQGDRSMPLDKETKLFADYLSCRLPYISIHLQILPSSRCGEIDKRLTGVEAVLENYQWSANWTDKNGRSVSSRDWETTKCSLRRLKSQLRTASSTGTEDNILAACDRVLRWGGDRNAKVGANLFLTGFDQPGQLGTYLRETKAAFDLTKDDPEQLRAVHKMNAMLSKVHALMADDGLPIYDSRVSGAIATMAELYRREKGLTSLPESIRFPATGGPRRRVGHFLPDAVDTCHINYSSKNTARIWTLAKWRLGRIFRQVLSQNLALFKNEGDIASRCHALEASLFMIGYDPSCLLTEAHRRSIPAK